MVSLVFRHSGFPMVIAMRRKNRRIDRKKKRREKMWSIFWTLLVCVVVLSFLTIDGYRFTPQVRYWWRNKEIKQGYAQEVEKLRQEQQQLKEEIDKLEHSTLAQERLAREMGYIKPGETVYKFVP